MEADCIVILELSGLAGVFALDGTYLLFETDNGFDRELSSLGFILEFLSTL